MANQFKYRISELFQVKLLDVYEQPVFSGEKQIIMHWKTTLLVLIGLVMLFPKQQKAMEDQQEEPSKLVVLWTSGDRETALKMVFMYTLNAQKQEWWDEVTLIIWGPSAELSGVDSEIQKSLTDMKKAGVKLQACQACSDPYGVTKKLESLGVEVKYMGEPLTGYLKKPDTKVVTF